MMLVEPIKKEHLSQIANIEKLCFSDPWSENALELLLKENCVSFAVTDGESVLAYGGMMTVLDEGHVLNIATHPDYRKRGFAREIMHSFYNVAEQKGLSVMFLEVREHNMAARNLYLSEGWKELGVLKNHYSHPVENAIVMQKTFS